MTTLQPSVNKAADTFMKEGIDCINTFKAKFGEAKVAALKAGYFFYRGRASAGEGNFETLVECYKGQISRATIYRAIGFFSDVIEWALAENPALKNDIEALLKVGTNLILQSPKSYIALCRQVQLMRKFGEYDEVKYAKRKLGEGGRQVEFDFCDVCDALDVLTQLGSENLIWKLPEDKKRPEALRELKTKLDLANSQVDEALKNSEAITT